MCLPYKFAAVVVHTSVGTIAIKNGTRGKLRAGPRPPATHGPHPQRCGEWENSGDGVTDAGWRVNREDCLLLVHPRAMSRVMGLPLALTGVPFPKPNLIQHVVDRM
jgi:hypothetical protein